MHHVVARVLGEEGVDDTDHDGAILAAEALQLPETGVLGGPGPLVALVNGYHSLDPCRVVAVGAPEDHPLVDELIRALAPLPCLDLCGKTTLPRLAALAEASDCAPLRFSESYQSTSAASSQARTRASSTRVRSWKRRS